MTSVELVRDCLARVEEVEGQVQAWAFLDRDHAMRQAEAADRHRKSGKSVGPLHGVPIGIKDIFDTGDMPTELGSPVWAGRTPRKDAAAVARLRADGAVIMGKTVTAEYAYTQPGKTRNPHDPSRTPAAHRADRPRRWPASWCRARSDRRPMDRSSDPQPSAALWASSRPTASSREPAHYCFRKPWIMSASSRARSRTPRC
jgi:hypothetical protein